MIRAAEKFDASLNIKFSTYALCWIEGKMRSRIQDENYGRFMAGIKVPGNYWGLMKRREEVERNMIAEGLKKSDVEEVARRLDITMDMLRAVERAKKVCVSSDAPLRGRKPNSVTSQTMGELVAFDISDADSFTDSIDDVIFEDVLRDAMAAMLDRQERQVVSWRLGLDGPVKTYLEVTELLGGNLTKQAVHAQFNAAKAKLLRHKGLKQYAAENDYDITEISVLWKQCPHCVFKAKITGNLNSHIKSMHPNEPLMISRKGKISPKEWVPSMQEGSLSLF